MRTFDRPLLLHRPPTRITADDLCRVVGRPLVLSPGDEVGDDENDVEARDVVRYPALGRKLTVDEWSAVYPKMLEIAAGLADEAAARTGAERRPFLDTAAQLVEEVCLRGEPLGDEGRDWRRKVRRIGESIRAFRGSR